jgi:hypothetical protein
MFGLPTFIENNPIPFDRMNWTLIGCEVRCKRVVSGQDNIEILNESDFCFALWPMVFGGCERAVEMSVNEALASSPPPRVAGEGLAAQSLKPNYPVALSFILAID